MRIRTSTHIRKNYNDVIEECRQTGEPIYPTKNGEGDAVVMDIASFERREQLLRAQQLVLEAYVDSLAGAKPFTTKDVKLIIDKLIKGK